MSLQSPTKRFQALDLLRGFFIVIIIVDHLARWPSIFGLISGKALLWVTAAEGFVIISGLLVGYIRGYKAKAEKLESVTLNLWRRALTLYIWAVLASIAYTAAIWYIPFAGGSPGMPIEKGQWNELIFESVTLNYTFVWVYFLKLYAIFLAFAPLAIWLLRISKGWLVPVLSLAIFALGWVVHSEVLQWQIVFFIPVFAGYYMPAIQGWWQSMSSVKRRSIALSTVVLTVATITLSIISTYLPEVSSMLDRANTTTFAKDSMGFWRVTLAFLWFTGYLFVFIYLQKYIAKAFAWLLIPIGTHSLTAYIIHGVAIMVISIFFVSSDGVITNSLLGLLAIVTVWAIVKLPGINKVIPR